MKRFIEGEDRNQSTLFPECLEDYVTEVLEMVSAWDIPDEELADAINAQARLMAGIHPDDPWLDTH